MKRKEIDKLIERGVIIIESCKTEDQLYIALAYIMLILRRLIHTRMSVDAKLMIGDDFDIRLSRKNDEISEKTLEKI